VRALSLTILIYSACSVGAALSQSIWQLAFWRALLGFGMGGEWAAGAVLVSETWPAELRNKATSLMQSTWALGAILAALLAGLFFDVLPLGAGSSPLADCRRSSSGGSSTAWKNPRSGRRTVTPES
jgi:MFS family permease